MYEAGNRWRFVGVVAIVVVCALAIWKLRLILGSTCVVALGWSWKPGYRDN